MKDEYVIFVLKKSNPTYFFNGYTNRAGDVCFIEDGKDEKGNVRKKRFEFNNGKLRIHKTKKKEIEFVENSHACEGSPNLKGQPKFYKLDVQETARKRVASKKDIIRATAAALELKGDLLEMVSVVCGGFTESKDMQLDICIAFAEAKPMEFLNIVDEKNLETLKAKSFIRKCVKTGVIKQQGKLHTWEGIHLGTEEEDIIAKLIDDPELYTSIEEQFKAKGGVPTNIPVSHGIEPGEPKPVSVKARKQKKVNT